MTTPLMRAHARAWLEEHRRLLGRDPDLGAVVLAELLAFVDASARRHERARLMLTDRLPLPRTADEAFV